MAKLAKLTKKRNKFSVDTKKIVFDKNSESDEFEIKSSEDEFISFSGDDDNDDDGFEINKLNKLNKKNKKNKKTSTNVVSYDSEDSENFDELEEEEEDEDEDELIENVMKKKKKNNEESEFTRISWGKEKKNYYQEGDEDTLSGSEENEEDKLERLKEAIYLNRKEKENLKESDFDIRNIYLNQQNVKIEDDEDDDENDEQNKQRALEKHQDTVYKLVSGINSDIKIQKKKTELELSDEQKKEAEELIISEQEEYKILLTDLSANIAKILGEINENKELFQMKNIDEKSINPSDINRNTLLYLKKKNETLLTYIIYITYYIFLKSMNTYNYNHPVVEKLIYMNTLLAKANELDPKIKFKINQLNNSEVQLRENKDTEEETEEEEEDTEEEEEETEEEKEKEKKKEKKNIHKEVGKKKNANIIDGSEEDTDLDSEEDDDDEKEEEEEDEDEEEEEDEDEEVDKTSRNEKYRVKKSIITEYTDSHIRAKEKEEKKKNREKMRNEKDVFIKELKSMISEKPETIQDNYLKKMEKKFSDFDNKLSKKQMKKIMNKSKKNELNNIGLTTTDLLKFVELPEMSKQEKKTNFEEKKIFRSNMNKLKQMKKNQMAQNAANDDYVTYKKVDKDKLIKRSNNSESIYGTADQNEKKKKRLSLDVNEIEDEEIQNMLKFKKQKKESRRKMHEEKNKEIRKKVVLEENQEVESRRKPDIGIIKNKGLIKKKKNKVSSARARHRQKYEKKMKAYSGQHTKLREHDDNYLGEQRGINPNIKKSMDIK